MKKSVPINQVDTAVTHLTKGDLIGFPLLSGACVACDALDEEGVIKLKSLSARPVYCLIKDDRMLERYTFDLPEVAYELLSWNDSRVVVLLDQVRQLPNALKGSDGCVGFLTAPDDFTDSLLFRLRKPMAFTWLTSDNRKKPSEFPSEILKHLGYVVPLQSSSETFRKPGSIRLFANGSFTLVPH